MKTRESIRAKPLMIRVSFHHLDMLTDTFGELLRNSLITRLKDGSPLLNHPSRIVMNFRDTSEFCSYYKQFNANAMILLGETYRLSETAISTDKCHFTIHKIIVILYGLH
jgi:hypothetical protein